MDRIASPQGLQTELRRLLDYSQSPRPSREKLAEDLRALAERVAASPALVRNLSKTYGLTSEEAERFADHPKHRQILKELDEWRNEHGFPATNSPLTRGKLQDLMGHPRSAAYGYETLPASEVDVGDYLVERDGAALEVEDVQKSGSYIVFTLKPYGMTRIAPQKVRATTKVRVQKKSRG